MTKEYFYFPELNKPCKKICDRCTIFQICSKQEKDIDNYELFN